MALSSSERRQVELAHAHGLLFAPVLAGRDLSLRGDANRLWAAGEALESATWVCLLAEIGIADRLQALALLETLLPARTTGRLRDVEPSLLASTSWTEHLRVGDFDAALGVRALEGIELDPFTDARVLRSVWNLALARPLEPAPRRFLAALALAPDDSWRKHFERPASTLRQMARALPINRPMDLESIPTAYDGLAWTIGALEEFADWAKHATPGEATSRNDLARHALVQATGRIWRWRLDLSRLHVSDRIVEVIRSAASVFEIAMRSVGGEIEDAWPGGFEARALAALDEWDELSSEGPGTYRPDDDGGGGGERQEMIEEEMAQAVGVPAEVG